MIGKEDGLFFSTKKDGIVLDYGEAVVKAKIPIEKLILDDIFDDEAHLRLPVRRNAFTNIDVLQESKVDDGVRFALKKEGESAAEKKLRREVERAKEKYERAVETKEAQLKAEYTTDTVFSQSSVKSGFDSVAEVKKVPAKVREEIARDLWLELAASDDRDVRGTFILKYSVKLYDAIRRADPDGYENMTQGERDALKDKLEAAMKKIVNSGKKSKWAKQKDDVRGAYSITINYPPNTQMSRILATANVSYPQ